MAVRYFSKMGAGWGGGLLTESHKDLHQKALIIAELDLYISFYLSISCGLTFCRHLNFLVGVGTGTMLYRRVALPPVPG